MPTDAGTDRIHDLLFRPAANAGIAVGGQIRRVDHARVLVLQRVRVRDADGGAGQRQAQVRLADQRALGVAGAATEQLDEVFAAQNQRLVLRGDVLRRGCIHDGDGIDHLVVEQGIVTVPGRAGDQRERNERD